jgi:uncharacterized membrane protein
MGLAALVGTLAGAAAGPFLAWQATVLIGWSGAAAVYLARVWWELLPQDPVATAAHATREDDSRVVADLTLLAASVASLVAVGLMLLKASQTGGVTKAVFTCVGVVGIALSWAVVHTVFTLQYGHRYYGREEPGIDFPGDHRPTYRDFAYVSFTIGMTYQVSDTDLRSPAIRATALRQALLSYLFGTAFIATTVNVVAGLVK